MSIDTITARTRAKFLAPSYQAANFGITQLFSLSGVIFGWLWYEYGLQSVYVAIQKVANVGVSVSNLSDLAWATLVTAMPAIVWWALFSRKAAK
jgi:hypothetical protein